MKKGVKADKPKVLKSTDTLSHGILDELIKQSEGRFHVINPFLIARNTDPFQAGRVVEYLYNNKYIDIAVTVDPSFVTMKNAMEYLSHLGKTVSYPSGEKHTFDLRSVNILAYITPLGIGHYHETIDSLQRRFLDKYGFRVAVVVLIATIAGAIAAIIQASTPTQVEVLSVPPPPAQQEDSFQQVLQAPTLTLQDSSGTESDSKTSDTIRSVHDTVVSTKSAPRQ